LQALCLGREPKARVATKPLVLVNVVGNFAFEDSSTLARDNTIGLMVATWEVAIFHPFMLVLHVGKIVYPSMHA